MVKPVLVTSAAGGRQGKTGRHVAEQLLARGVPVRALVRKLDERSERLRALGAEIFEGDFLNIRSVQRAAEGTSAIYFAYPVQDGLMDATAAMAVAAREAGVTRLVNLVMLQSSPDAPTPRMRQNYLSEQVFEWANVGATHIRATVFYENLASMVRQSLPAQGAIRLPWGNESTVLPLVAAEDVARVAVGLLTGPQPDSRQLPSADRHDDFAEGDRRDLRPRDGTQRALRGDFRRAVAPRRGIARLQSARHRASLLAVARDPRRCDRSERSALCGHGGDRKDRRREAEDVRGFRARGPKRVAGEIGLSRE